MPSSLASRVINQLIDIDAWTDKWKKWHLGKAGRPDCTSCHGQGIYFAPNGADDVEEVICPCVKNHEQITTN